VGLTGFSGGRLRHRRFASARRCPKANPRGVKQSQFGGPAGLPFGGGTFCVARPAAGLVNPASCIRFPCFGADDRDGLRYELILLHRAARENVVADLNVRHSDAVAALA